MFFCPPFLLCFATMDYLVLRSLTKHFDSVEAVNGLNLDAGGLFVHGSHEAFHRFVPVVEGVVSEIPVLAIEAVKGAGIGKNRVPYQRVLDVPFCTIFLK